MRGRRVDMTGGHLVFDECGPSGPDDPARPAIVLLHGLSFDRSSWDPQFAPFAARHRTIRYDLRGFGESGPPVAGRSHLDDLVELLDRLEISRAHLVGLSLGANVALAAMVNHSARVATAVLAAPGLPGHRWTTPRPPDEASDYAGTFGVEAARRFWLEHDIFASTIDYPEVRAHLERMVAGFDGRHWVGDVQTDPLPPVNERLAEIDVPTLVLHGGRDLPGYQEIAHLIGAAVPGAQRYELARAGHLLNLEQPEEFTARVLDFIAATS